MDDDRKRKASESTETDAKRRKSSTSNVDPSGWSPEIHREFVQAIFSLGLSTASPSIIMRYMNNSTDSNEPTAEHVKSHLQKYRKNKVKSKSDFMADYDAEMVDHNRSAWKGMPHGIPFANMFSPCFPSSSSSTTAGAAVARLTLSLLKEEQGTNLASFGDSRSSFTPFAATAGGNQGQVKQLSMIASSDRVQIPYPTLSKEESNSPLGAALYHVMGAISALSEQLLSSRSNNLTLPSPPTDDHITHREHTKPAIKTREQGGITAAATAVAAAAACSSTTEHDEETKQATDEEGHTVNKITRDSFMDTKLQDDVQNLDISHHYLLEFSTAVVQALHDNHDDNANIADYTLEPTQDFLQNPRSWSPSSWTSTRDHMMDAAAADDDDHDDHDSEIEQSKHRRLPSS